ncbi:MAG: LysM peptidoglycan-binding domain-containing protein, partial [Chlamydiota bacterium]
YTTKLLKNSDFQGVKEFSEVSIVMCCWESRLQERILQKLETVNTDYQQILSEKESLSKTLEARSQQLSLAQQELGKLDEQRQTLADNNTALKEAQQELLARQQERKQQLSTLQDDKENLTQQLQLSQEKLAATQSRLQHNKQLQNETFQEIQNLKEKYSALLEEKNKAKKASKKTTKIHLVAAGETLSAIAQKYYGSSRKWATLYEANKDIIDDKDYIKPGTALVIP